MSDDDRTEPTTDRAVRRLIASARHDEPMPSDVVDRLDAVIAGLAAERDPAPAPASPAVLPLRRRRVGQTLLAAAAVAAIGFGVTQVVATSRPESATTSSDSAVERPQEGLDLEEDRSMADGGTQVDECLAAKCSTESLAPADPRASSADHLPRLRGLDEESLRDLRTRSRDRSVNLTLPKSWLESERSGCGSVTAASGARQVEAVLRSRRVLVVYTPRADGSELARVHDCSATGGSTLRATVVLSPLDHSRE